MMPKVMWNGLVGVLSLIWIEDSCAMSSAIDLDRRMLEGRVKNRVAFFEKWQKENEAQPLPILTRHAKEAVPQPMSTPEGIKESQQVEAPVEQLSTSSSQIFVKEKAKDAFAILESYVEEHKASLQSNGLLENYISGLVDIIDSDDEPLQKRKIAHDEMDQWWSLLNNTQVWGKGPFGINIGCLMAKMLSESLDCDSQESVILKGYQKGLIELSDKKIRKLEQLREFKKIAFDFYDTFNYEKSLNKTEDESPNPWWK